MRGLLVQRLIAIGGAVLLAGALVVGSASAASTRASAPPSCKHLAFSAVGSPRLPHLTQLEAVCLLVRDPKVADWLKRYPKDLHGGATLSDGLWTVSIATLSAGVIAQGAVVDSTGKVVVAWTGAQVEWSMARGTPGAFGGKSLNSWPFWLVLCGVFFLGLADLRRIASLRNLDLLVLLGFSVSLFYFDRGQVFASASLVYPPLVYLLGRAVWIGLRGSRAPAVRAMWPVWLLVSVAVFATTFRIAADVSGSQVIDVGYSGVIGAQRLADGVSPYGHMPVAALNLRPCGPPNEIGQYLFRVQTNGRCELADPDGDTYGPVAYEAYLPGYALFGWSTPLRYTATAKFTSILFDLLCLVGMVLVGRRFGGNRMAATLAFAWTTFPFTLYALCNNTNDTVQAAFLIWGFWLCSSPVARGALGALAGWAKFAPLIVAPMWATYPNGIVRSRSTARFAAAFAAVTVAVFSILLLEPNLWDAMKTFWDRALVWQVGRQSPFSIWDWRQYDASGLPDLHLIQDALQALLVVAALVLPFYPKRKSPLQLAALTGALLLGFQMVQTYWFYTYIPWFFPFVAIAILIPHPAPAAQEVPALNPAAPRPLLAT